MKFMILMFLHRTFVCRLTNFHELMKRIYTM